MYSDTFGVNFKMFQYIFVNVFEYIIFQIFFTYPCIKIQLKTEFSNDSENITL